MQAQLPTLVLQPFIENAILHGLLPRKSGGGILYIGVENHKNGLQIIIRDNGIGRKAAALKKAAVHSSKGISLTEQRLKLINEQSRFTIIDLYDAEGTAAGTEVQLLLFTKQE